MRAIRERASAFLLICAFAAWVAGCGRSTRVGNPGSGGTPPAPNLSIDTSTVLDSSISGLVVCPTSFEFVGSGGSSDVTVLGSISQTEITLNGMTVGGLSVPEGTYSKILVHLSPLCGTGGSLQFTNRLGAFVTTESATLEFDGTFSITGLPQAVQLDLSLILGQLESVTEVGQSSAAAAAATGSCYPKIGTVISLAIAGGSSNFNTPGAACALTAAGTIWCWGPGGDGQLGNGSLNDSALPVRVSGITNAVQLSGGDNQFCAVLSNGTVECWGLGNLPGDQNQPTSSPYLIPGITGAVAVTTSSITTYVLLSNGQVICWGDNTYGECGSAGTGTFTSAPVTGISGAVAIDMGYGFACAILSTGAVECWGNNISGQLGNGTSGTYGPTPTPVTGITNAKSLGLATGSACAALTSGSVMCWGAGTAGQLGNGSFSSSSVPVAVSGITTAVSLSQGKTLTSYQPAVCAVLHDGTAWCWGYGSFGGLGNASNSNSDVPVQAQGVAGAVSIVTDGATNCALFSNGGGTCWGLEARMLGTGVSTNRDAPVAVTGLSTAVSVAGTASSSCAALASGTVECWGSNAAGELGDGTYADHYAPAPVSGLSGVTQIAAGYQDSGSIIEGHVCALTGGTIWCWGLNTSGQLGSATPTPNLPVQVPGITTATAVAAGGETSCALLANGTVQCWGDDSVGQTDGVQGVIPGLSGATAVSVGGTGGCALVSGGSVYCWGYLVNTSQPTAPPVAMPGITSAVAISVGDGHACAVNADGTAECWGDNIYGQLGDGSDSGGGPTPVSVTGLTGAVAVAAGFYHTCALKSDGTVACWGFALDGELGNRAFVNSDVPVAVADLTGITGLGTGAFQSCAIHGSGGGVLLCWGLNHSGQLGNGDASSNNISVLMTLLGI